MQTRGRGGVREWKEGMGGDEASRWRLVKGGEDLGCGTRGGGSGEVHGRMMASMLGRCCVSFSIRR